MMEAQNYPKRNLGTRALRLLPTAALALVSAGFPLFALTLMIATVYQLSPDRQVLVLEVGLSLVSLTTIVITFAVHRLSDNSQRQAWRIMAVIAVVGVFTTALMRAVPSLAWTFPRYLPLVTLLKLDSIDVTGAEDAVDFETWFEIWFALIPLAIAAKWGISRILPYKRTLIPHR